MKKALFILLTIYILTSCSHKDEPIPFLTLSPNISSMEFSSDGKICTSNGEIIIPSFTISTNQDDWEVLSDQNWCTINIDRSKNVFTITVDENDSHTSSPVPATIKVLTSNGLLSSIKVSQKHNPQIYVAGYEMNDYVQITPTYWIDGETIQLNKDPGSLNDILVFNGEVHAVGYIKHKDHNEFDATYWKNGKETTITHEDLIYTYAKSIFKYNDNIYIAVNYDYGVASNKPKMGYWENGKLTLYTDGSNIAIASSIFVYNNDIYIAGTYNYHDACYWKNGERIKINTNKDFNDVSSIFISNGDIYLAGPSTVLMTEGVNAWNNGVSIFTFNEYSYATDIFVIDNDVYILGVTYINGIAVATYWKNGERVSLSDGITEAYATSIYVSDNEIFVSGYQRNTNRTLVSVYWRNGKKVELTDGSREACGNAIFVVK